MAGSVTENEGGGAGGRARGSAPERRRPKRDCGGGSACRAPGSGCPVRERPTLAWSASASEIAYRLEVNVEVARCGAEGTGHDPGTLVGDSFELGAHLRG